MFFVDAADDNSSFQVIYRSNKASEIVQQSLEEITNQIIQFKTGLEYVEVIGANFNSIQLQVLVRLQIYSIKQQVLTPINLKQKFASILKLMIWKQGQEIYQYIFILAIQLVYLVMSLQKFNVYHVSTI
ncbi:unnamed protein product [Paramecium pentaurelia]|uniref:Transmembrane protein n=1 Tax=Paramecium pentaurelia TaxID=43138 RepID=A0A8S1X602_9CILI|nr:unnamed protein product [Paramecium pentaurelia]